MHLVQLMDWRGAQPQHVHHICTKCNGPSIEARCTSRNIATVWSSECVHNYRPLWWSRYRPRESVCCTCLCVCVCELTVDLQLARWSILTLLGHALTSGHRSSSRSQEKNVSIVVGATSSEGFYSYSFWFGAWQWRFFLLHHSLKTHDALNTVINTAAATKLANRPIGGCFTHVD